MGDKNTIPLFGKEARKKILAGVNAVYNVLKLTLGPEGKNAILPRTWNRGQRITNDGYTISENIKLKDEHMRLSADAFKEGSKKTNELAGDGTTSTAVLAGHLINKIFNQINDDIPTVSSNGLKEKGLKGTRALRAEILELKNKVILKIKEKSKKIETLEDLEKIAIIAIGKEDKELAKIVAKTVWDIARDEQGNFLKNNILVTEGFKNEIEIEKIEGMKFPAKVPHRNFVNNLDRFEMVVEDTPVLITNYKIDNNYEMVDFLTKLKVNKITIFAPEFSLSVLKSMIASLQNGIYIHPVKCPALRTDWLEDLAVYTGATLINKDIGQKLSNINYEDLGFAEKIIVKETEDREDAVLIGGKGEKIRRGVESLIASRADILKKQLIEAKNDTLKIDLEKRIANLCSAVGIIRVGATTNNELLYLKLKTEDGVYACKSALQEGYVKGGGLCLKEIAEEMEENILTETLKEPYEQIQKNAGGNLEIGEDVLDPAKVVRLEVEHGISVASVMITTDILIPDEREKNPSEGYEYIARAISKWAYYDAKHKGLLRENEMEAEKDMEKKFEEALLFDKD